MKKTILANKFGTHNLDKYDFTTVDHDSPFLPGAKLADKEASGDSDSHSIHIDDDDDDDDNDEISAVSRTYQLPSSTSKKRQQINENVMSLSQNSPSLILSKSVSKNEHFTSVDQKNRLNQMYSAFFGNDIGNQLNVNELEVSVSTNTPISCQNNANNLLPYLNNLNNPNPKLTTDLKSPGIGSVKSFKTQSSERLDSVSIISQQNANVSNAQLRLSKQSQNNNNDPNQSNDLDLLHEFQTSHSIINDFQNSRKYRKHSDRLDLFRKPQQLLSDSQGNLTDHLSFVSLPASKIESRLSKNSRNLSISNINNNNNLDQRKITLSSTNALLSGSEGNGSRIIVSSDHCTSNSLINSANANNAKNLRIAATTSNNSEIILKSNKPTSTSNLNANFDNPIYDQAIGSSANTNILSNQRDQILGGLPTDAPPDLSIPAENRKQLVKIRDLYYRHFFPKDSNQNLGSRANFSKEVTRGDLAFRDRLLHMFGLLEMTLSLFVRFTKSVFELCEPLSDIDKMLLIKECAIASLIIRHSITYNRFDQSFCGVNGKRYRMNDWVQMGSTEQEIKFCFHIFDKLSVLYPSPVSKPELAGLLCIVALFNISSDSFEEPQKIGRIKQVYKDLLRDHCLLSFNTTHAAVEQFKKLFEILDLLQECKYVFSKGLGGPAAFNSNNNLMEAGLMTVYTEHPLMGEIFNLDSKGNIVEIMKRVEANLPHYNLAISQNSKDGSTLDCTTTTVSRSNVSVKPSEVNSKSSLTNSQNISYVSVPLSSAPSTSQSQIEIKNSENNLIQNHQTNTNTVESSDIDNNQEDDPQRQKEVPVKEEKIERHEPIKKRFKSGEDLFNYSTNSEILSRDPEQKDLSKQ